MKNLHFAMLLLLVVAVGARKLKPTYSLIEEMARVKKESECNKKTTCAACSAHGMNAPGVQVETFSPTIGFDFDFQGCYWDPNGEDGKKCRMKQVSMESAPTGTIYLDPNQCSPKSPTNAPRKAAIGPIMGPFRPIRPGISLSQLHDAGPGTIAAVIKGKTKLYIVSNAHVLSRKHTVCNTKMCPPVKPESVALDYVTQQAGFNGAWMEDVIGKVVLTKHANHKYQSKDVGLDIALVELCTGKEQPFPLCRGAIEATNYLPPVAGEREESFIKGGTGAVVAKDAAVEKLGSMSGKASGKVFKIDYSFSHPVRPGATPDQLDNQLLSCDILQEGGDSGGPLFTGDPKTGAELAGVNHGATMADCVADSGKKDCKCVITSPIKAILHFLDNSDDDSIKNQAPFTVAEPERATTIDNDKSSMKTVDGKLRHIFHYKFATPKQLTTAFVREHVAHDKPPAECPPPKEDDEDQDKRQFAKAGAITHGIQHTTEAKQQQDNHDVMHYCTYKGLKDGDTSTKWKFTQNYQYRDNDGTWQNAAPSFIIHRWAKREGKKLTAFVSKKGSDDNLSHETKLEIENYYA